MAKGEDVIAVSSSEVASLTALQNQSELLELPARLFEFWQWKAAEAPAPSQAPVIGDEQPSASAAGPPRVPPLNLGLSAVQPSVGPLPRCISFVKGAVLGSQYAWLPDELLLESVRATPDFYGHEYFDCVCVERERAPDSPGRSPKWYAQLRLLFSMEAADAEGNLQRHQLAMVRWFAQAPATGLDRIAERFGCRKLQWATKTRQQQQVPYYTILPLDSILRRECILPDCKARSNGLFFLNTMLWSRNPAG